MVEIAHSEEKLVKVNNIEINYDTFGDSSNPAMLLIMGLGGQLIMWHPEFCQKLAASGYWVIRFDNRDVGLSTKLTDTDVPNIMELIMKIQQKTPIEVPYKLIDMAKDAIGLLDALEIASAHIIGVSMGGMIAQTIAIQFPERIKTLISIMSSTGNPNLPQAQPEAMEVLLKTPPKDRNEYIEDSVSAWKILHGSMYLFNEDFIRERSALAYDRSYYPVGPGRQLAAILASGSRNNKLQDVTIPTLVIHGDTDPLIPIEGGKDTANSIFGSELLIIEGMGHSIPDEVAPQIIKAIVKKTSQNN